MTNKKSFVITVFVLSVIVLFVFGCSVNRLRGLVPVEGIVFYDGKPVAEANVTFYPENQENRTAVALTDANGKFKLTTLEANDGAFPGAYKVTVVKYSAPPNIDANINNMSGLEKSAAMKKYLDAKDEVKSLLPTKYAAPNTSGLTVTVSTKGVRDLKLEL
ncbi:MAG: DUF4198 domain-containing protein [Planctomycetaceae bacterium]|jgi:hypothetical protein|nr:DUF4198 domain-containing protein [Planctomycetaceae bacterium]